MYVDDVILMTTITINVSNMSELTWSPYLTIVFFVVCSNLTAHW